MNTQEAVEYLKKSLEEVPRLKKLSYNNNQYILWIKTIKGIVEKVFGRDSTEYQQLATSYQITGKFTDVRQNSYEKIINRRAVEILSIIKIHETLGKEPDVKADLKPPTAFIAHEGETEQLKLLKEFLDALGIKYFIAETEASDGRSIEGQVDWTQVKADFAICLATKGKAVNKETGKHYMGLNVADELGRARQIFRNKIILLVQEGVEVHTNTREIVYAPFTTHSMDIAFIKVIKELRNWGFIKTEKI
jgi:hypothetical protein